MERATVTINVAALEAMVAQGATAEMILIYIKADQAVAQQKSAKRRQKNAARMRRARARVCTDTHRGAQPHTEAAPAQSVVVSLFSDTTDRAAVAARPIGSPPFAVADDQKEIPPTPPKENNLSFFLESINEEKKVRSGITRAREIVAIFENEFWSAYPKRDGANPKTPARKVFVSAVKSGHEPQAIVDGARRYRDAVREKSLEGGPYVAQAVTWLRQARWGDYPEPPAITGPPKPPDPTMPSDEELRAKYAVKSNG